MEEEEAKEWEERKEGAQEGELTDLNEDTMGVKLVDPSYQSEWVERGIRSKADAKNRTPLPTVAKVVMRGECSRRIAAAVATATLHFFFFKEHIL